MPEANQANLAHTDPSLSRTAAGPMGSSYLSVLVIACLLAAVTAAPVLAQEETEEDLIESAVSAAPTSISAEATIMNWPAEEGGEMTTLREGTNGWTCMPDMPRTEGTDPMCLDDPWMEWADAWMNEREPNIDRMGFGYMLQGGAAESNTDPYAQGPTEDNEWIGEGVPHLMVLVPDPSVLAGLPTHPDSAAGPWVMWRDTPYEHIMVPMPQYQPDTTMTGGALGEEGATSN